jgi:Flagellar biogenesis protein
MLDSIVQLFTVLLIFVFVLALAYITTKLTAGLQKGRDQSANVGIVETLKIAPTKYIQVVRIGEKYFSYVVCKDTVTLLGELAKDDITEFAKDGENALAVSFKDIFEKLRK